MPKKGKLYYHHPQLKASGITEDNKKLKQRVWASSELVLHSGTSVQTVEVVK